MKEKKEERWEVAELNRLRRSLRRTRRWIHLKYALLRILIGYHRSSMHESIIAGTILAHQLAVASDIDELLLYDYRLRHGYGEKP